MFQLLKTLTSLHGPCGYEQPVTTWIKNKLKPIVDEVEVDPLGNVIARKKGTNNGPKMIITAHMDEVGFIVKKIENNGLLRFEKLGGHDDRILLAQKVQIRTQKGLLTGVIGTMSAHFVKFDDPSKVRNHRQLYIDVGASSKEVAEKLGIEIGNPITWVPNIEFLGNETTGKIVGKGFDDRAGCAVILQTLEEVNGASFNGEIIAIFTVQEEVGLRGAKVAAERVTADVAIAIDTTAVSDTPEETMDGSLSLGDGTGIKIIDFSLIAHPAVKEKLIQLARQHSIPFQHEVFPGIGTDGGAISLANKGIPTGVLSIPSRYAHSPVEVIDLNDLEATKNLLKQFILEIDENEEFPFLSNN
ncbi:M42 family metallopeptidase [Anaerobacillus isosaccharinicus]|uniref:Endoglucanase n=1 Tax=Anaerobacillus isosaccharinicus TaxID=1532552 RepID=A0A1S2LI52_9BACI|nr:M42 family metallopeptidase [Anaerobacillus isosaccharinicus]MBA5586616.1 M42 family metallopeptidase [Anaerobacillus isosaccharinicus]QOY35150.1 M42 family metallopeptidase [Anaerobacillus isosaccharinicus]